MSNAERRVVTRRTVLDAAAACFDEAGYLATRLDDVTARANLTKGAVYFHFGSKQALASAVIEEQALYWPDFLAEIGSRPGTALEQLVSLTYEVSRLVRENVMVRAGLRLALDNDLPGGDPAATLNVWTDRAAQLLRSAKRAGLLADTVTPARTARVVVAFVLGACAMSAVVGDRAEATRRLDDFWALLLPRLTA